VPGCETNVLSVDRAAAGRFDTTKIKVMAEDPRISSTLASHMGNACGGRFKVMEDRPSKFSDPKEVLSVFVEKAKKGESYSNREVGRWLTTADKKEHNPSMVRRKMAWLYDKGLVAESIDKDTKRSVGWRKK
jgi:hypothetical protein